MIIEGLSEAEYARLDGIRASWLKTLATSTPAHLRQQIDFPQPESDAFRLGRALHCRILTPDRFASAYTTMPKVDRRTKEGKEAYAKALDDAAGREILDEEAMRTVDGMASAVLASSGAAEALGIATSRETVMTAEIDGEPCKCRVDAFSMSGLLLDIKTTTSAAPRAFARSVVDYGYLLQMAFYRAVMIRNGIPLGKTVIIAVEKAAPFGVAVYEVSESDIDFAFRAVPSLVARYALCQRSGFWYGYPSDPQPLRMPEWYYTKEQDNE
jgi:exodeoxyribonuclease VIII